MLVGSTYVTCEHMGYLVGLTGFLVAFLNNHSLPLALRHTVTSDTASKRPRLLCPKDPIMLASAQMFYACVPRS